jgi:hypothetical protein
MRVNAAAKSKISFNVPDLIWSRFRRRTDDLFLAIAPFLDHVLARELHHVSEDLRGYRMTPRAKRHVSGDLHRLPTVSVNIEVRVETAERMRRVVSEHNLVRDALFLRLIVLLIGAKGLTDSLSIPDTVHAPGAPRGLEDIPVSPLDAIAAITGDPLFYLREFVRERWKEGLYRIDLEAPCFAVYLSDEEVPGTKAFKNNQKMWRTIFGEPEPKKRRRPAAGRR